MYLGLNSKCLIFLSDFNKILILLAMLLKSPMSNFTKIHPVAGDLIYADRWTDTMKQFRHFSWLCECASIFHKTHLLNAVDHSHTAVNNAPIAVCCSLFLFAQIIIEYKDTMREYKMVFLILF